MEEENLIKETEIYLLAQFIDVLESMEEFNKIEELKSNINERKKLYEKEIKNMISKEEIFNIDEIDRTVNEKIEKYSKIYCKNKDYKKIEDKISEKKKELKNNEEKITQLEDLIYEKCDFDSKCAYKIGMIEAIKILTLKN